MAVPRETGCSGRRNAGDLTVREILFDGIGGTLPAIAAMRLALGLFFVLSGIHKLRNKERHKTFVETLKALGIPRIEIFQWFVPGVEFFGGLGVAFGFLTPLAALGLLVICSVALLTSSPKVIASYKPIDRADRLDDWLYQPELIYALMLLYFMAAGAGPVSIDHLLKTWIG
jgi:putative oxidoreductase